MSKVIKMHKSLIILTKIRNKAVIIEIPEIQFFRGENKHIIGHGVVKAIMLIQSKPCD